MSRDARIYPQALEDIRRITRRIAQHVSTASSVKWTRMVQAAVAELSETAESCPEADEAADLGVNLRIQIIGKRPHVYRILYTYTDDFVFIHRVRHAAQDWLTPEDF